MSNFKKRFKEGENILKVYRHHPIPFIFNLCKAIGAFLPFYILLAISNDLNTLNITSILSLVLIGLNLIIIIYISLIYWLDELIITNERICHVDWISLTHKMTYDIELVDIQQINIENYGIINEYIPFFDYGILGVQGGSGFDKINFVNAWDPYSIKRFLNENIPHQEKSQKKTHQYWKHIVEKEQDQT